MSPEQAVDVLSPSERERIMSATAALCAKQGYEETTAEQIAERAGVSRDKLETLFDADKEQCVLAAINELTAEVIGVVASSYSADRSEWDSGIFGMKAILELMAAHPSFAHLAYIGARQMGTAQIATFREGTGRMLKALMERLRPYSDTEGQPTTAAAGAFGGAEAVVRREIMAGRTEQLPRLLPDFVYGTAVPFLGQEEALCLSRRARELLRGTEWG